MVSSKQILLTLGKLSISFFDKQGACDNILLRLPTITLNSIEMKRESFTKFLGVTIDENITWNKDIDLVENEISKNISIIKRASHYPDK